MDSSRVAPLVLRLGRQPLRKTHRATFKPAISTPFSSSTVRPAAPLPPSPDSSPRIDAQDPRHTSDASTSQNTSSSSASPPPKRSIRPYLWISGFILVGVTLNAVGRAIVFPPPLPDPDTEEDAALVSKIKSDLNSLPIVTELRKDRSAWREYDPYSQREAFMSGSSQEEAEVGQHLTAGTLRGARALAVQRSFYNATEKREISVIFFGGAVSGWPGVTHGGLIMTVLKEAIERAANGPVFASKPDEAQSTALPAEGLGEKPKRLECETLTLNYKKPTQANKFYVIRADVQNATAEKPAHTFVKASLEDGLTGSTKVLADGHCIRGGAVGAAQSAFSNGTGSIWTTIAGLFGSTA